MTIDELRSSAAALALEIDELSKLEDPTDEQTSRFDAALAEVDPLADEIRAAEAAEEARVAREAKLEEIRAFAAKPAHVQSGDGARVAPVPGASTRNIWDMDEARMASNGSPASFAAELRSRAEDAIASADASDEVREQATRLLERGLGGAANGDGHNDTVARHWLTFGSPEYRENWEKALRGDAVAISHCEQTTRAAWAEGATTTGGFAVVPDYDLTLQLINSGTTNPFRQISRVVQTNSNQWKGLTTAGVTAGWITESTEEGDDTPTVAQPSVTVHRAGAYLQASFEVIADSNLGAEVGMLLQDAKDQLEANAFATGTGGGQPFGVVTRCQSLNAYVFGDSGSTTEKEIVQSDIYALDNALAPRYRPNASFVANKAIWNQVRQAAASAANNNTFWVDFGNGLPSRLIGYPVYESSVMDSTVVSGSQDDVIVLGDFRHGYLIADRIGMTMAYNPLVIGSNRRPTGEVGWFMYWRTGADVVDQTNASHFKLLHK
jgi:HK97 family phage major capsid protein